MSKRQDSTAVSPSVHMPTPAVKRVAASSQTSRVRSRLGSSFEQMDVSNLWVEMFVSKVAVLRISDVADVNGTNFTDGFNECTNDVVDDNEFNDRSHHVAHI